MDLFGTGGASLERRLAVPPGGQTAGGRRKKTSEYGLQLREKQTAKHMYGVLERQFRRYFAEAARLKGATGEILLQLLERRLDNVIYRLGFARSRPMARQLVTHGHVYVNDRRVNIPSYQVRPGESIRLSATAAKIPPVADLIEDNAVAVPAWLDKTGTTGRVVRLPAPEEMEQRLNVPLIVEFYSR
jgi:small subunit ribosomal protein S4